MRQRCKEHSIWHAAYLHFALEKVCLCAARRSTQQQTLLTVRMTYAERRRFTA